MQVIKYPEKPVKKDPLYETECPMDFSGIGHPGCGAVLRFNESEIEHIRDQRDGDADYIVCPVCGKTIWRTSFNFRKVEE